MSLPVGLHLEPAVPAHPRAPSLNLSAQPALKVHGPQSAETLTTTTDPSSCSGRSSSASSSSPKSRISIPNNHEDENIVSGGSSLLPPGAVSSQMPARVSTSPSVTFASTSKKGAENHAHTRSASENTAPSLSLSATRQKARPPINNALALMSTPKVQSPLALEAQICSSSGGDAPTITQLTTLSVGSDGNEKSVSFDSRESSRSGLSPIKSALASISTATANRRSSMSTSETSSIVELRKLLADGYEAPLTAKQFQEFVLKHKLGDESIQFHNRVMKFKVTSDHDTSVDMVREIYDEHLAAGAPNEIKLPGGLRTEIVSEVEEILRREDPQTPSADKGGCFEFDDMLNLESQLIPKTVFDDPIGEVERWLYRNSLPKFIRHSIENLHDPTERFKREISGIIMLILAIGLAIGLTLSSFTPWARVSVHLPLSGFTINFAQLRTRV